MMPGPIAVVERVYNEFYNEPNFARAVQVAPSIFHDPQRFIDEYKMLRTAFPDMRVNRDRTLQDGNFVVVRWSMRGTQQGVLALPLVTVPPTGRAVSVLGISIFEVLGGQITSRVWANDSLDMLFDLGVRFIPPSSPPRSTPRIKP